MASRYLHPKFDPHHTRYIINAINNFASREERPDPVIFVTWGARQNREASKLKTLARVGHVRSFLKPSVKSLWWPAHRSIMGAFKKRISREKERWYKSSYSQAKQLNKRVAKNNSGPASLLWGARGEAEVLGMNLRDRKYSYHKSQRTLNDWRSAAMRATRKSGFSRPDRTGPQDRVTDLWELCIRYNSGINRDRVYGALTITKSRRGKLEAP